MEENFGHAMRTLEARVDALDNIVCSIRQKDIDNQVQEKHHQKEADVRFKYDVDILDIPGHPHHVPTSPKRMHREAEKVWDTYRASFTVVMTKGYLQASRTIERTNHGTRMGSESTADCTVQWGDAV
eukprot:jgi/Picre1/27786/NNA_000750.t1